MKKLIYLLVLVLTIVSCSSDEDTDSNKYEFILEYTTQVTVGGVIGTQDRTFEIGEVYFATNVSADTITLRIAEHTALNDDCPNSWCYQELLGVPSEYLQLVE